MADVGQAWSPRPDPKKLLARQMNPQIPDTVVATARMFGVCQGSRHGIVSAGAIADLLQGSCWKCLPSLSNRVIRLEEPLR